MSLSGILRRGLVERFGPSPEDMKNELGIAKSDLSSAKKMLTIGEWGWAHNAAYNAMLQAGRALLFSKGYRPKSTDHHLAVVSFVQAVFSSKFAPEVLEAFSKARLRRNESMYDRAGSISERQARSLVEKAEIFVTKAVNVIKI